MVAGKRVAVYPHSRAGSSRAGRPEEVRESSPLAPATRALVTGAEGARVGEGRPRP